MRTLVNTRDILEGLGSPLLCPLCSPGAPPLEVLASHLDISRKGTVTITRSGDCPEHGHFTLTGNIKAAQMHGLDCQIVPRYE